jgi:lysine/arginine/ornithine transport system substrate-binding protein
MNAEHLGCAVVVSFGTTGSVDADNTATPKIGTAAAYPPFESKTATGHTDRVSTDSFSTKHAAGNLPRNPY